MTAQASPVSVAAVTAETIGIVTAGIALLLAIPTDGASLTVAGVATAGEVTLLASDLYLLGKPLLAAYSAFRSGHAMNNRLLRELLAQPDAYEVVVFDDEKRAPRGFASLAPAW